MKDKLIATFGIFGQILFYLFTLIVATLPLVFLGFSWWVNLILLFIVLVLNFSEILSGLFFMFGRLSLLSASQSQDGLLCFL